MFLLWCWWPAPTATAPLACTTWHQHLPRLAPPHHAGESLNPEEAEAAEAELQQMEEELTAEQGLEMPRVPGKPLPAAAVPVAAAEHQQQEQQPQGAAEAGTKAAAGVAEEALAELPSVPTSKVQLPAGEDEAAAEAQEEAEAQAEQVLVAA